MFKLSVWSKKNPRNAIFIIAVCHLILLALAIIAGIGLAAQGYSFAAWITPVFVTIFEAGIGLSQWMLTAAGVIFSLIFYYFPDTHANYFFKPRLYYRQKLADFSLVFMTHMVFVIGVTQFMARGHLASAKSDIPVAEAALQPIDLDTKPSKI